MKLINFAFVLLVTLASVWASEKETPSVQCPGLEFDNLRQRIKVEPCGKTKCKLTKGTNVTVSFTILPPMPVHDLRNSVSATIGGLTLPFIGVDGTSACQQITNAEDGTAATCPLKPHQEYIYVNNFYIEEFYPSTDLIVHWSLDNGKKSVICFEVPATITAGKKNKH